MSIIPKILFQTSKQRPSQYIVDLIQLKIPLDWSYRHFTDEDVIKYFTENPLTDFPNIIEKYKSFEIGAHKADLFRYYYLYINGGVYIDTDVVLKENIASIIKEYTLVTVFGTMFPETMFNGFLAASPKNKLIYQALKGAYYCDSKKIYDDYLFLCRELYKIILPYRDDSSVALFREAYYTDDALKIINDKKATIAWHFWKKKNIPKYEKIYYIKHFLSKELWPITKFHLREKAKKIFHSFPFEKGFISSRKRQKIFHDVYDNKLWGSAPNSKFFSGPGSHGEAARVYVDNLVELLKHHAYELKRPLNVVDLGCGDFAIGKSMLERLPNINYLGCDIVAKLVEHNQMQYAGDRISFKQLDIVTDKLPDGDVYLVRQVLQHLSNAEIISFFQRIPRKYIYVTEGHPVHPSGPINPDKLTGDGTRYSFQGGGGRGVELSLPPFNLPTKEMFRANFLPHEIIVTTLVFS